MCKPACTSDTGCLQFTTQKMISVGVLIFSICFMAACESSGATSKSSAPGVSNNPITPAPISPTPPTSPLTPPQDTLRVSISSRVGSVKVGTRDTFTAKAISSTNSTIISWLWLFGDGEGCSSVVKACEARVSHAYSSPQVFSVSVTVIDQAGSTASSYAQVIVVPAPTSSYDHCPAGIWTGGAADGPAELLQHCMPVSRAYTPSPGSVVTVQVTVTTGLNNSLQLAYNAALCGQTLVVPHGTVFSLKGKQLVLAAKNCDDANWITIESDGALPQEGTRVTSTDEPQMFTLQWNGSGSIPLGDHIRFIGLEVVADPSGPATVDFFYSPGSNNIVWDQVWLHGNPGQESRRGIALDGITNAAVVSSMLTDFHCIAKTGTCLDSQAIGGGGGDLASGTWAIENNDLSAAGENILFGGGEATQTPCDIYIGHNYFYKPLSWNPSDPTFVPPTYIVKNLFELKNACRLLLEGNVFENNWGGFTQEGFAMLIDPKNQSGLAPIASVVDVTIRYDIVHTAAGGLSIGNTDSDSGAWATAGNSYSFHDLVFDNLKYPTCYLCGLANINELGSGYRSTNPPPASDVLNNALVSHITEVTSAAAAPVEGFAEISGPPADNPTGTPQISNVQWVNSISDGGTSGTDLTGGETNNCAYGHEKSPVDELDACFVGGSLFVGNLFVGAVTTFPPGNSYPATWSAVEFTNYNGGFDGDYTLLPTSPYKNSATDGTDPGADIALVNSNTQGVVP